MIYKLLNLKFILLIYSISIFYFSEGLQGRTNLNNSENFQYTKDNLNDIKILKTDYILGAGDEILIKFLGLEDNKLFTKKYRINPQGYIFLQEINYFMAEGKTLDELKKELEIAFEEFIINPSLDIEITSHRPVNFYLHGEVREPGLYTIKDENTNNTTIFPKLYDALKEGKGLSNNADISKIEVIRINSKSQGGGKIRTEINLLDLFNTGSQDVNISIYDGDSINVKRSKKPLKEQILNINRTNITPGEINVIVTGNAISRGTIKLRRGSSLVQALASGGGKKLFSGNVEFIRFNSDGSTTKKVFKYNPQAEINAENNPILMDGDLINVKRTALGASAEFLRDFTSPIIFFKGLTTLFDD
tara:strand:- start:4098 stop:5180 length:1083 start_codon:yes stop_codon:yes gene_type:complete